MSSPSRGLFETALICLILDYLPNATRFSLRPPDYHRENPHHGKSIIMPTKLVNIVGRTLTEDAIRTDAEDLFLVTLASGTYTPSGTNPVCSVSSPRLGQCRFWAYSYPAIAQHCRMPTCKTPGRYEKRRALAYNIQTTLFLVTGGVLPRRRRVRNAPSPTPICHKVWTVVTWGSPHAL